MKSRSRRALEIAALGAIYYLTARLGLLMQLPGTTASAVWPPSGIGLAAMLLCGLDVWPGIAIGALLANLLTLPATWVGFTVAVAIATGTTLEQVVVVMLMRRLGRSVNPFERASSALWFVAAAVVACVLAATNGVMALRLSGLIDSHLFRSAWLTWWVGDLAGIASIAAAGLRSGTHTLTVRWKFEVF